MLSEKKRDSMPESKFGLPEERTVPDAGQVPRGNAKSPMHPSSSTTELDQEGEGANRPQGRSHAQEVS